MLRVGIDVGGTFTDLFAYDTSTGQTYAAKAPTTVETRRRGHGQPQGRGVKGEDIDFLSHGTTTGLNALIERKGHAQV